MRALLPSASVAAKEFKWLDDALRAQGVPVTLALVRRYTQLLAACPGESFAARRRLVRAVFLGILQGTEGQDTHVMHTIYHQVLQQLCQVQGHGEEP